MNDTQNRNTVGSDSPEVPIVPPSSKILRFQRSERLLHWSLAIPFLVCLTSAVILIVFYNPHPHRAYRLVFSWIHRISGGCLIFFPLLTAMRHWRDYRLHLRNVREAWSWSVDDVKWLVLTGLAAVSGKTVLPDQGKFNAAEKLNFMTLTYGYPVFITTGLILWATKIAFVSWMIHLGMAAIAAPLILGHMYMAIINRGTRVGLDGMFSGYVDREWAKHHYTRWYRENFEPASAEVEPEAEPEPVGDPQPAEGFD